MAEPRVPEGDRFLLQPSLMMFLERVTERHDLAVETAASGNWMTAGLDVTDHALYN
ncbi:hypothetical protein [Deinococcus taeanensis]|uniref:hypothetical protein n=1 Tax=Deinococcus taeanensis TaxID=2737050 RepID=UPI002102AED6|nr:hypothetical protein [Deinococcus taeanensis]